MKTPILPLLLGCFILLGIGCKDDSPTYESCCANSPLEFSDGNALVYLANVFTPDGDTYNEVFTPSVNPKVTAISDYKILDRKNKVIFEKESLRVGDQSDGWNGKDNGEDYNGQFSYEFTIVDDGGNSTQLSGSACVLRCNLASMIEIDISNCKYPDQGFAGAVAPGVPTVNPDCF